ncbi:MAG: SpoIIE family protein phosphatase [Clostridia bacterium]|nr:SpoIIE family protein phosphatase [Clostridia bacterium]
MIEKYYRSIINKVKQAICVVGPSFKVYLSNPAFNALFNYSGKKGTLGEATRCAGPVKRCGQDESCRGCPLAEAFDDAFYSSSEVRRRIFQKVLTDDGETEVSYSVTVSPLGGGLVMCSVDDAYELEIAHELRNARNIQQRLLPAGKWAGGKRYSFTYIPCREIGGDLPDVYELNGAACGMIADVSGKGISAGMLSAFVKAAYDKKEPSPAMAISKLSDKFRELKLDERNYITMAAVHIDKDTITYSMAGHNTPILLKSGSSITRVTLSAPPVSGWFDNPQYFDDTIPYKKGDILVLLTDGVTECRNGRGEMFGEDGVMKTLSLSPTADVFIKKLEESLVSYSSNQTDDVTVIAFDL